MGYIYQRFSKAYDTSENSWKIASQHLYIEKTFNFHIALFENEYHLHKKFAEIYVTFPRTLTLAGGSQTIP